MTLCMLFGNCTFVNIVNNEERLVITIPIEIFRKVEKVRFLFGQGYFSRLFNDGIQNNNLKTIIRKIDSVYFSPYVAINL